MDRNLPTSPGNGTDGSAPSEAWLFAQAILGEPIPRIISPEAKARAEREELEHLAAFSTRHAEELRRLQAAEAEARHEREILEWAAGISTRAQEKLSALRHKEDEKREAWQRARQYAEQLLEGAWDPSQHPRAPKGQPDGGQWVAQGSGRGGAGGTSGTRDSGEVFAATTASHVSSKGVPVQLAAAQSAGGHHWVPQMVFGGFESRMTKGAFDVFKGGTKSPELYDHAFDTWNGITHDKYSAAARELLDDWITTNGGKLEDAEARKFLSWIATGKCGDEAFAAKHNVLFDTVFKWRKGFLQSIAVAHAAAEINPKLMPPELKAIAQQIVNGKPTKPLSKAAAKAARAVIAGGKPLLKAAAKKVLPGLVFFSAAMAARRGWAGEGHTGDGAWGAINEVTRDLMIADVVEPIVFPAVLDTVDGLTNLLAPGLNSRGRNRYIRRGGKLVDLETGRVVQ